MAMLAASPIATAHAQDAIVGSWIGMLKQDDGEPFEARLTFVSPKGGISRYPSSPCGGILAGGPKGEGYQYTETISWGAPDELAVGCIGGVAKITVDGDVMQFSWSTVYEGNETHTVGELKRRSGGKRP